MTEVRIGFVPLLDAAPLIMASELGFYQEEGLSVSLHRQIGWGNVRDKLIYGQLHASHALVGMPPVSVMGLERFPEPVVGLMGLGCGGNAITLARRLTDAGVRSASLLLEWLRTRRRTVGTPADDRPIFAHVFGCSMHHYLLRHWLSQGGINPDRDVRLCVLPPPQMARHMKAGYLAGYCVGEPWNSVADQAGQGRPVITTHEVVPNHPEKVLAVNHRWLAHHGDAAIGLVRAVLRACMYIRDRKNLDRIADCLARTTYLNLPRDLVRTSLASRAASTIADPAYTYPDPANTAWILREMIRWGHLPESTNVADVARRSVAPDAYRDAAASLGIELPSTHQGPLLQPRPALSGTVNR